MEDQDQIGLSAVVATIVFAVALFLSGHLASRKGKDSTQLPNHFLMRGLEKVRAEFSLSGLAYNIKRAITIVGVRGLVAALS